MIDIASFCCYLLLLGILGYFRVRHVKKETSYLLADRNTGLFALTATLVMTEFNTSTLLGFSSVGFSTGLWGLSLPFVFLVGLGFYTVTVAKKWNAMEAFSVAELFTQRYGIIIGRTASILLLLAMIGFTATYVKSITLIFMPLVPAVSFPVLSGVIVFFILILTLRGGLVSVIYTDVVSFIATLFFIPALFLFTKSNQTFSQMAETFPIEQSMEVLPPSFVLSLIVLTMFTYIAAPWYGQKIFSARNEKTAFLAVAISACLVFILYGFPVLSTGFLKMRGISPETTDESIPVIINMFMPAGIRGLSYGILFSISATTLAGVWNAMSTMVIGDFLKKENGDYKRGMTISFFFALICYILGNTLIDNILNKLILANIPVFALSFALLAAFHWKRVSRIGAIISMILGFIWGCGAFLIFGEEGGYTTYWAFIGLPIIFLSGIAGSLFFPEKRSSK